RANLPLAASATASGSITITGRQPSRSTASQSLGRVHPERQRCSTRLRPGAYNGLSGGLGAGSAAYFLRGGADTLAANPLAAPTGAAGTMTGAGVPANAQQVNSSGYAVTATPLLPLQLRHRQRIGRCDARQFRRLCLAGPDRHRHYFDRDV